jgi:hypothetical protein
VPVVLVADVSRYNLSAESLSACRCISRACRVRGRSTGAIIKGASVQATMQDHVKRQGSCLWQLVHVKWWRAGSSSCADQAVIKQGQPTRYPAVPW